MKYILGNSFVYCQIASQNDKQESFSFWNKCKLILLIRGLWSVDTNVSQTLFFILPVVLLSSSNQIWAGSELIVDALLTHIRK